MNTKGLENGMVNPLLVATILLAFIASSLAGFSVWSFSKYQDYKKNSDAKALVAVDKAKKSQAAELEKQFIEREKQPYVKFEGPDALGHVSFDYPKTWSVYVEDEGSDGMYSAYLNPVKVPPVSDDTPYAVRVEIVGDGYDSVLNKYNSQVKKNLLKTTPITVNGFTGVRLDGEFSKNRTGSLVVFKIRDKTLQVASDSTIFRNDFDNVLIKSLDFNP